MQLHVQKVETSCATSSLTPYNVGQSTTSCEAGEDGRIKPDQKRGLGIPRTLYYRKDVPVCLDAVGEQIGLFHGAQTGEDIA